MKVGFIGLGDMGERMATHILSDHDLYVYNRTPEKADPLIEKGATWTSTPRDMMAWVDVVILMVSDNEACENMIYGPNGLLAADNVGTLINMSTISPDVSIKFDKELRAEGWTYLEAPVSGTLPHAESQDLIILVGGELSVFDGNKSLLELMGRRIERIGGVGTATKVKLLINSILATQTAILAETFHLASVNKLEPKLFLDILNDSALANVVTKAKGQNMIDDEFKSLFRYRYLIKDLDYTNKTFQNQLPKESMIKSTLELYKKGDQELHEKDFSAIRRLYMV